MHSGTVQMNITRDETRGRARLLEIRSYEVDLDLCAGDTTFGSDTTVRFGCSEPGATTFVDLVADRVEAIELNGRALDPAEVFDGARITLDELAAENVLRVRALCLYMNTGEGLHRFVDPVDKSVYLYSQFQVADSRRVFAVFEQPDLKATFEFKVTAPADWQVVSNQPAGPPEPAGPGNAKWRFAPTERLSSYVTAVVAGPYHRVDGEYRDGERVIPLGVFCRASLAPFIDADVILEETRQGFEFFERVFRSPYPFVKYDQLFVPEFNEGAMENAGCVTLTEEYVFRSRVPRAAFERRAQTILHEMAHMWFGDLVTMTWWDDLWLNESFAEWVSTLATAEATQWASAWTTFANTLKSWGYRQDQLPSSHPIAAEIRDLEDVAVNFDGITYAKGAAVLKQLAAWVGQEQFLDGIRSYFRAHAWGNTTLTDLLTELEETSGRDLREWSAEWLETAGVNTLRPALTIDEAGRYTSFAVEQTAPEAWPTLRSHRLAVGLYSRSADGLVRQDSVELDVTGPRTEVPALVGVRAPDLVLVNDEDLTYAKVRLDERSLATLTEALGEIQDDLARATCWTAAWDMVRDAETPTRTYLSLALRALASENDSSVVLTVLRQLEAAVLLYTAPQHRERERLRLADGLAALLGGALPGSDNQLQFLRSYAATAVGTDHHRAVRRLLDGADTLEGLGIDTDLRWHLLHHLVAAGHADESDIERELDRDDTAAGRRAAASAMAARPTGAAKREAWDSVMGDDELPNATQVAVIRGFTTGRPELLQPFVAEYFDSLRDVWAHRTNETAQNIVTGLFPTRLAEPATVEAADGWLDDQENRGAPPTLRRLVLESRDALARALRAQARDAQD